MEMYHNREKMNCGTAQLFYMHISNFLNSIDPLLPKDNNTTVKQSADTDETENKSENALSFWKALLLPGVILVSG